MSRKRSSADRSDTTKVSSLRIAYAQIESAIYLGVVPTILGYLCWNWALSRAPASKVTSFIYMQPLVASAIAWAWLGQVPGWLTAAGGVLAVSGVVLTVRSSRAVTQPPKPVEPVLAKLSGRCAEA